MTKENSTELERLQKENAGRKVYEASCLNAQGEEVQIFILQPKRKDITDYLTMSNTNMHKAEQKLIASSVLNRKDEVSKNDTLWGSVMDAITQVIPETGATIKNS